MAVLLSSAAASAARGQPACILRCGQSTPIAHIAGRGRPLLREGGPTSYEARPSGSCQPVWTDRNDGDADASGLAGVAAGAAELTRDLGS